MRKWDLFIQLWRSSFGSISYGILIIHEFHNQCQTQISFISSLIAAIFQGHNWASLSIILVKLISFLTYLIVLCKDMAYTYSWLSPVKRSTEQIIRCEAIPKSWKALESSHTFPPSYRKQNKFSFEINLQSKLYN